MTRNQSIGVLNDTTDALNDIDEMLRRVEDTPDVSTEIEWVPGDPLYDRPNPWGFFEEQYVRPMIEDLDIDFFHTPRGMPEIRCRKCYVSWKGDEPCFICGEEVEDLYASYYDRILRFISTSFPDAMVYNANSLRELNSYLEFVTYSEADVNSIRGFGRAFSRNQRFVFRDELLYYTPSDTVTVNGITIPREIPMGPVIKVPEIPGRVINYGAYSRPPGHGPGADVVTRNRRPRNI